MLEKKIYIYIFFFTLLQYIFIVIINKYKYIYKKNVLENYITYYYYNIKKLR